MADDETTEVTEETEPTAEAEATPEPEAVEDDPYADVPDEHRALVKAYNATLENMTPLQRAQIVAQAQRAAATARDTADEPAATIPDEEEADRLEALAKQVKALNDKLEAKERKEQAAERRRDFDTRLNESLERVPKEFRRQVRKEALGEIAETDALPENLSKLIEKTWKTVKAEHDERQKGYVKLKEEDAAATVGEAGGTGPVGKTEGGLPRHALRDDVILKQILAEAKAG